MASSPVRACELKPDCQKARAKLAQIQGWRADADVANAAYGRPPPAVIHGADGSVKTLVTDPAELADAGLRPSDLTIPGTNFGAVVYKEGQPPLYTASFRGTEEWLGSDMRANIDQALDRRTGGAPTEYYSRAQAIAKRMSQAAQANGNPAPEFTGHSLGGGLASAAAASVGAKATTFNAAGLNPATVMGGINPATRIDAVHVRGEFLTALQQMTPAPEAFGTPYPLDPPFHLGRDLLAQVGGGLLAGPWGVGGAEAVRSGMLHKMGNVTASLDKAGAEAQNDVDRLCCGG